MKTWQNRENSRVRQGDRPERISCFSRKNPFTLIELLVVIGLMAMIMGIGLPAFNKIASGTASSQASRELAAQINAARAIAVNQRCHVAMVFPTAKEMTALINGKAADTGKQLSVANSIGSSFNGLYRIALVYKKSNTEFKFLSWADGEKWNTFPVGVVIGNSDTMGDNNFGYETSTALGYTVTEIPMSGLMEDNDQLAAATHSIIFKPNGQVYSPSAKKLILRMTDAIFDVSVSGSTVSSTFLPKDANTITYTVLTVNPYSGRVQFSYE